MGLQGAAPAVGDTDAAWSADANAITGQGLYARSEPVLGEQEMHLVVQLRREGVDA